MHLKKNAFKKNDQNPKIITNFIKFTISNDNSNNMKWPSTNYRAILNL